MYEKATKTISNRFRNYVNDFFAEKDSKSKVNGKSWWESISEFVQKIHTYATIHEKWTALISFMSEYKWPIVIVSTIIGVVSGVMLGTTIGVEGAKSGKLYLSHNFHRKYGRYFAKENLELKQEYAGDILNYQETRVGKFAAATISGKINGKPFTTVTENPDLWVALFLEKHKKYKKLDVKVETGESTASSFRDQNDILDELDNIDDLLNPNKGNFFKNKPDEAERLYARMQALNDRMSEFEKNYSAREAGPGGMVPSDMMSKRDEQIFKRNNIRVDSMGDEEKFLISNNPTGKFGIESKSRISVMRHQYSKFIHEVFANDTYGRCGFATQLYSDGCTYFLVPLHVASRNGAFIEFNCSGTTTRLSLSDKKNFLKEPTISLHNDSGLYPGEAIVAFTFKNVPNNSGIPFSQVHVAGEYEKFEAYVHMDFLTKAFVSTADFKRTQHSFSTKSGDCGAPIFGLYNGELQLIMFHIYGGGPNNWNGGLGIKGHKFMPLNLQNKNAVFQFLKDTKSIYQIKDSQARINYKLAYAWLTLMYC
jgi:hypothetical protein